MAYKVTSKTKNRFVVSLGPVNMDTVYVEVVGKKKALKAAGLPTTLVPCTPSQSRWGKGVSVEEAKSILNLPF